MRIRKEYKRNCEMKLKERIKKRIFCTFISNSIYFLCVSLILFQFFFSLEFIELSNLIREHHSFFCFRFYSPFYVRIMYGHFLDGSGFCLWENKNVTCMGAEEEPCIIITLCCEKRFLVLFG